MLTNFYNNSFNIAQPTMNIIKRYFMNIYDNVYD